VTTEVPATEAGRVAEILRQHQWQSMTFSCTCGPVFATGHIEHVAGLIAAAAEQQNAALRTALDQPPMFQQATCCSFAIGSHYNSDRTIGGDLEPPHEPVIDPLSGVVMVPYATARALLSAAAPAPARETQEGAERG